MRTSFALLALLLFLGPADAAPKVTPIPEQELENCGCVFRIPVGSGAAGRTIAQWDGMNWDGKAKMIIDDEVELFEVRQLPAGRTSTGSPRIGQVTKYNLSGSRAQVNIAARITRVCQKEQKTCEETQYDATFSVRSKRGTSEFKAWAACGC